MKLPEVSALVLLAKYGFSLPAYCIVSKQADVAKVFPAKKYVVKANLAVGGKKKTGLVAVANRENLKTTTAEILSKNEEFDFYSVLVEEFVDHDREYFLALKAIREGIEVYYSDLGGIEIENNWASVKKVLIPEEELLKEKLQVTKVLAGLIEDSSTQDWVEKLVAFFQNEDATYLEINPFTLTPYAFAQGKQGKLLPLGIVLVVDETAAFRHPDWADLIPEQKKLSMREQKVAETDGGIRGSIKLVEVPGGGDTALMAGGGGAALFFADAIINNGKKLANYAEFSGNPPNFAVTELTRQVCAIPGIENLVIGSGIANFTPVNENIRAIIEGLRQSPNAGKINIVVRRCGPGEDEGIQLMTEFARKSGYNIRVFGRETSMTDIVKKLYV